MCLCLLTWSVDFAALPAGQWWWLEVTTCGFNNETTFDTVLLIQNANPYRHGIVDAVRSLATACFAGTLLDVDFPDHLPVAVVVPPAHTPPTS